MSARHAYGRPARPLPADYWAAVLRDCPEEGPAPPPTPPNTLHLALDVVGGTPEILEAVARTWARFLVGSVVGDLGGRERAIVVKAEVLGVEESTTPYDLESRLDGSPVT